jgi:hypothetical protein
VYEISSPDDPTVSVEIHALATPPTPTLLTTLDDPPNQVDDFFASASGSVVCAAPRPNMDSPPRGFMCIDPKKPSDQVALPNNDDFPFWSPRAAADDRRIFGCQWDDGPNSVHSLLTAPYDLSNGTLGKPVTLVNDVSPFDLVIDGGTLVYFGRSGLASLDVSAATPATTPTLLSAGAKEGYVRSLSVDSTHAYWLDGSVRRVERGKTSTAPPEEIVPGPVDAFTLAGSRVVWSAGGTLWAKAK